LSQNPGRPGRLRDSTQKLWRSPASTPLDLAPATIVGADATAKVALPLFFTYAAVE
jgi:hypothetical protein